MSELFNLQEIRYRNPASFSTDFTDGDNVLWTNAISLRHTGVVALDGVSHERIEDPTVQKRARARPRGIKMLRTGSFTVQLFLNSSNADDAIADLLELIYGGRSTPSANEYTLDSTGAHTTSRLYASGIDAGVAKGSAVLCGTRGDGLGDGEVHVVIDSNTNYIDLATTTKGLMVDGNKVWPSHCIYPDYTQTQEPLEFYLIGEDTTGPDQLNCIGCAVSSVSFSNLNLGDEELPIVELEVQIADHRWEPTGSAATLAITAPSGADPAMDKALGGFFCTDRGSPYVAGATRGYLHGGGMTLDPDMRVIRIPGPLGVNGITGWRKAIGSSKFGFQALIGEGAESGSGGPIPNLTDDFDNGVAKQLVYQWGATADAAVAVDLQQAWLDKLPTRLELEEQGAVDIMGHGDEDSGGATELLRADHRIHFFHTT
jgi:hypothetical protein